MLIEGGRCVQPEPPEDMTNLLHFHAHDQLGEYILISRKLFLLMFLEYPYSNIYLCPTFVVPFIYPCISPLPIYLPRFYGSNANGGGGGSH